MKLLSNFFTALVQRFLPDPFVFALILTVILFVAGIVFTPHGPIDMIRFWGDGFWNLLAFAMQMSLILVTGHALASSPLVKQWLRSFASVAKTPAQGVILVTLGAAVASLINWGFGLIVGALFAKEVAKRVPGSDYRLLVNHKRLHRLFNLAWRAFWIDSFIGGNSRKSNGENIRDYSINENYFYRL
jgi:short-chain fatty acids transporter